MIQENRIEELPKAALPATHDNVPLRSEAAQELINRKGSFVERRALWLFFIVILLLLSSTWFIRYPDIIYARAYLTARNAPKEIVGFQTGRLVRLFVKNGDYVRKGQMIGWIESTADANKVVSLSRIIDSSIILISQKRYESIPVLFNDRKNNLGELQASYQAFITALQQYNDYWVNGYFFKKREMLLRDLVSLKRTTNLLHEQMDLSAKDRDSAKVSLKMNKYLLDQKVISPEEYRTDVSKYNSKVMALPQYEQSILSNANHQRSKQKEIDQLVHDGEQQQILFSQALQTFKSNIDEWLQRYTIRSPIDGKIVFTIPLQQNKYIEAGKLIGFVSPSESRYYAQMYLPQNNFGKIDSGMQVQLRFDAYPYQEAGFVKAHILYISPVAVDSGFLAQATLSDGLVSSQGYNIQYKNGLKAQALVITRDTRLLQRIYYNIVKSFAPEK